MFGVKISKRIDLVKQKLTTTLILALLDFDLLFEIETNATGIGIGVVLKQEGMVIAYFSEKQSDARKKWTTYEQEFYGVVRAFKHWEYYVVQK